MQKAIKFLERNVQWLALGIGGIYLLYMVWAYVVTSPVSVALPDGTTATPGTIDPITAEGPAQKLQEAMNDKRPFAINVPDVITPYLAKIDEKEAPVYQFANAWGGTRGTVDVGGNEVKQQGAQIAQVPTLPAADFDKQSSYLATIQMADPKAPPPKRQDAQPVMMKQDTPYVSLEFKVSADKLSKAFTDAFNIPNVPEAFFSTMFLRVELLRQEKLPSGAWSEPKPIAPLSIHDVPPFPDPGKATKQQLFEYKEWAGEHQDAIYEPTFFEVAPGTVAWVPPGEKPPELPAPGQNQNPAAPAAIPGRPPIPPYMGRGRMYGRGYPTRPLPPGYNGRPIRPGMNDLPGRGVPGFNPRGGGAAQGAFDVTNLQGDLEVLAHDITVQDGHTYRYAIRYSLLNPLFEANAGGLAAPKVLQVYALTSPAPDPKNDKQWSPPVTVESRTDVYVTAVSNDKANFDVFEWKDGQYQKRQVTNMRPGDMVRPTNWTVVDTREDLGSRGREKYVLLMDPTGMLVQHDPRKDMADPKYQKLKAATEKPQAALAQ